MDAFSFLKHWRRGGAGAGATVSTKDNPDSSSSSNTTIVTAVTTSSSDSDDDHADEGPFFDLEFALPEEDTDADVATSDIYAETSADENSPNPSSENQNVTEKELVINVESDLDSSSPNFKGHLCSVESSQADTKFSSVTGLKSAAKLGVLMLKFKKSKSNSDENATKSEVEEEKFHSEKDGQRKQRQNKFLTVKLKVEEGPLASLFTRDFNSKSKNKPENVDVENPDSNPSSSPDRKFGKDVMNKYLKKVKPMYVRVSKRYGEKLGLSGEVKSQPEKSISPIACGEKAEGVNESNGKNVKHVNLQAGLKVVYKQLGKSRSASSAAVAAAPAAPAPASRRDDSLLLQQDGIQSAILHCKRSFNASRDLEASIFRSSPSHEKSVNLTSEDSSCPPEEAKVTAK